VPAAPLLHAIQQRAQLRRQSLRELLGPERAIVAGGPVDPVAFSKAKHDWIAATLAQLGLSNGRQRRL
jgi:hypothetical protein